MKKHFYFLALASAWLLGVNALGALTDGLQQYYPFEGNLEASALSVNGVTLPEQGDSSRFFVYRDTFGTALCAGYGFNYEVDYTSFVPQTGDFTCAFWFYSAKGTWTTSATKDTVELHSLLTRGVTWQNPNNQGGWGLFKTKNGAVRLDVLPSGENNFSSIITDDGVFGDTAGWVHIAWTRNGTTVTLYINGTPVDSTITLAENANITVSEQVHWRGLSPTWASSNSHVIASGEAMDDLAFWNRALSAEEIASLKSVPIDSTHVSMGYVKKDSNTIDTGWTWTLDELEKNCRLSARMAGKYVNNAGILAQGYCPNRTTVNNVDCVQVQFQGNDSDYVKCVLVRFTKDTDTGHIIATAYDTRYNFNGVILGSDLSNASQSQTLTDSWNDNGYALCALEIAPREGYEVVDIGEKKFVAKVDNPSANTGYGNNTTYKIVNDDETFYVAKVASSSNKPNIFGGSNNDTKVDGSVALVVTDGEFGYINGGSNAGSYGDNSRADIHDVTGDIYLKMTGGVTDWLFGGNWKDGREPQLLGNISVLVEDDALVLGSIAGGGFSSHNRLTTHGSETKSVDLSVTVKNMQTTTSVNETLALKPGYIVGGGVYHSNADTAIKVKGNTSVTIDLSETATGTFVKSIVGAGMIAAGGSNQSAPSSKVTGNSVVTVKAPSNVRFSGKIVGGGYQTGSAADNGVNVGGNSTVSLTGGIYEGKITAGGVGEQASVSGTATLNLTDCTCENEVTSGNVSGESILNINGTVTLLEVNSKLTSFTQLNVAETATLKIGTADLSSWPAERPLTITKASDGVITLGNNRNVTFAGFDGGEIVLTTEDATATTTELPLAAGVTSVGETIFLLNGAPANGTIENSQLVISTFNVNNYTAPFTAVVPAGESSWTALDWKDANNQVVPHAIWAEHKHMPAVNLTLTGDATIHIPVRITAGAIEIAANEFDLTFEGAEHNQLVATSVAIQSGSVTLNTKEVVAVSYAINENAVLNYEDELDAAFPAVSGAGTFVKLGNTTLKVDTENLALPKIEVQEGELRFNSSNNTKLDITVFDAAKLSVWSAGKQLSHPENLFTLKSGSTVEFANGSNGKVAGHIVLDAEGGSVAMLGTVYGTMTVEANISGKGELALTAGGCNNYHNPYTISGVISGDISIRQMDDNENENVILSGANTYTGTTTVNSNLKMTGAAVLPGAVTIAEGKTLTIKNATLNGAISGAGALDVTGGTVILTAANTYSGGTTVSGGTLKLNGTTTDTAVIKEGTTIDVAENATLELVQGRTFVGVTGKGTTKVTGNYTFGLGASQHTGNLNLNTKLIVGSSDDPVDLPVTLTVRSWQSGGLTPLDVELYGKIVKDPEGQEAAKITIPTGKSLKGTGTLEGPLVFAEGAILDATAGALTVTGDVQFDNKGFIVKFDPAAMTFPVEILKKSGLVAPTAYTIQVGDTVSTEYQIVQTADNAGLSIAEGAKPIAKVGDTSYASLTEALAAALAKDGRLEILDDPATELHLTNGQTLILMGVGGRFTGAITVDAGATLTLSAGTLYTEAAPWTFTGKVTNNGSLITEGHINLSKNGDDGNVSTGTITVESGILTLYSGNRTIKGIVTIKNTATLIAGQTDGIQDDDSTPQNNNDTTLNVYGTLNMATARWSIGSCCTINLYDGATVIGTGDNVCALDIFKSKAINVYGEVTISAPLKRKNNADHPFTLAENAVLTLSGELNGDKAYEFEGSGSVVISHSNSCSGGIEIDKNVTVTVANAGALGSGKVTGDGTVLYTDKSHLPTENATTFNTAGTSAENGWHGIVKLSLPEDANDQIKFAKLGNASSTLEFAGVAGWQTVDISYTFKELRLSRTNENDSSSGGLTINDGSSNDKNTTFNAELTGNGPLNFSHSSVSQNYKFMGGTSNYTGKVTLNNYRVSFGDVTLDFKDANKGILAVGANNTANVCEGWSVAKMQVAGILKGTGSISGNSLSFANNATLDTTKGTVTANAKVTFPTGEGETLNVKVAEMPKVGVILAKGENATFTNLGDYQFVDANNTPIDAAGFALEVTDKGLEVVTVAIASFDGTNYPTLQAAIDAAAQAEGAQTVTVLVSTNNENIIIPAGATITLSGTNAVLSGTVVVDNSSDLTLDGVTATQGIRVYKTLNSATYFASDLNKQVANDATIGGFRIGASLVITMDEPLNQSLVFVPADDTSAVYLSADMHPTQANLDLYNFADSVIVTHSWSEKTPIAVWDRDFKDGDAKVGAITFNQNGNFVVGGSLVIGNAKGAVFTGANDLLNEATYIIEGKDLIKCGDKYTYLWGAMENDATTVAASNKVCVVMRSDGHAGIFKENGNASMPTDSTLNLKGDSTLIITASTTGGVSLYRILPEAPDKVETVFEDATLTFESAEGFSLGGVGSGSSELAHPEDWTIDRLAVFNRVLTTDEMLTYAFPSQRETVNASTYSSAELNAALATKSELEEIVFAQDVELSIAGGLNADVKFVSGNKVALVLALPDGATLPADGALTSYDFSHTEGDVVLNQHLTPAMFLTEAERNAVVGFNFHATAGGDTSGALETGTWVAGEDTAGRAKLFEGLSTLTWQATAVVETELAEGTFQHGALSGNVTVTLTNLPNETYDIVLYGTAASYTVNNTEYTADSEQVQTATGALRVKGLTGATLTIACESLAAIQILPAGLYTGLGLTVPANETTVTWETATNWTYGQVSGLEDEGTGVPTTVTVSGDATVTVANDVTTGALTVQGPGNVTLQLADGVTFTAASLKCATSGMLTVTGGTAENRVTLKITEELPWRGVVKIGENVDLVIAETVNPVMRTVFDFEQGAAVKVYLADEGDYKVVQRLPDGESVSPEFSVYIDDVRVEDLETLTMPARTNTAGDIASVYRTVAKYPVWLNHDGNGYMYEKDYWSTGQLPTGGSIIMDVQSQSYLIGFTSNPPLLDTVYVHGQSGTAITAIGGSIKAKSLVLHTPGISLVSLISQSAATVDVDETLKLEYENNEFIYSVYNFNYQNTAVISGPGSVRIQAFPGATGLGAVTMTQANTYSGGTVVEEAMSLTTNVAGGYGAPGSTITVASGATVDVANTTTTDAYNYVIAGSGIFYDDYQYYTGALYHIPTAENWTVPYVHNITLAGDALIRVGEGRDWGMTGTLDLKGHSLRKQAPGTWHFNGVTGTYGTCRIMEGALEVSETGATLAEMTLSLEDAATLTLNGNLSGLAACRVKAGNKGITFNGVENYDDANPRLTVDASYMTEGVEIDTTNADATIHKRGEIVLMRTGENETFQDGFIEAFNVGYSRLANGRLSDDNNTVIADVFELYPFLHYDFNGDDGNPTTDSLYQATDIQGRVPHVSSRHGKAGQITGTSNLRWESITYKGRDAEAGSEGDSGTSPFNAGVVTITTLLKPQEVGDRVVWALGDGANATAIVLVAQSANTLSVERVAFKGVAQEIMSVEVTNLTTRYHFVVLEIDPGGGRLRVWNSQTRAWTEATSLVGLYSQVPASGRLGHIHGNWLGGLNAIESEPGCYLDDWQIYDVKLTEKELNDIRLKVAPDRAMIQIR